MITKDSFSAYAQYNEDIILAALLYKVKQGFYVDVGANHEEYHSVTKYFYLKGWKGINIEPIPGLIKELEKKRKHDINLQIALSSKTGKLKFREYPGYDGLSTLSEEAKADTLKTGLPAKDYTVKVDTLKNVLEQHSVKQIDFLKIDVEGYEEEVLKGNDWTKYRPTVICIEANHRSSDWADYLVSQQYVRVIFDGLNEYYVAEKSIKLFDGFADRATLLNHNAIQYHQVKAWQLDIDRIKFLEEFANRQDELIKSLQALLEEVQKEAQSSSFKNKTFKRRLALALQSLTTDYYHHKSRR